MKRLIIMTAFLATCMFGMAQSEDNYSMYVYLSGGDVEYFLISEVDSVVFTEVSGASSDDSINSSDTTYINGYAAVDLGLSVLWATCNIGADSPEDYGDYFAWGETETKDSYKYSNSVTFGYSMGDISGNAEYDAATANWGDSWRMPTYDEMNELIDSCTWEWTSENAVNGYLVTGPSGNSIFLPAAGWRYGMALSYEGSNGRYWSSTPYISDTYNAYYLHFHSSRHDMSESNRYYGRSVRPVSDY